MIADITFYNFDLTTTWSSQACHLIKQSLLLNQNYLAAMMLQGCQMADLPSKTLTISNGYKKYKHTEKATNWTDYALYIKKMPNTSMFLKKLAFCHSNSRKLIHKVKN